MIFRLNLEFDFHGCVEHGKSGLNVNTEQSAVVNLGEEIQGNKSLTIKWEHSFSSPVIALSHNVNFFFANTSYKRKVIQNMFTAKEISMNIIIRIRHQLVCIITRLP